MVMQNRQLGMMLFGLFSAMLVGSVICILVLN
jgi:hypothetical protein